MSLFETIIIAIVEGLTEYLPVSSTGHMIIAQKLLNVESTEFVKAFTIIIQFGAILSVIVLYWKRFFKLNEIMIFDKNSVGGLTKCARSKVYFQRFLYKYDFYWKLVIAFIPAMILGLLFNDLIDKMLESVMVVAVMLVLGGILMLFVDKWFNHPSENQTMDWKRALKIGFFQCISMIPGVSRSMATIVGGMTTKLTRKNAAEFSFFLAVPTMAGASGLKMVKMLTEPGGMDMLRENAITLIIGCVVAFIVAMAAIRFFIDFLTKYGFKAFGYYRIIVGTVIIGLLLAGLNLSMV
ncbi:MAG TPA: undecaprenyl-diphosphate phosphatase [Paludibacteraceae bacterium]|jgi:undecaprenyl-diphosphatase|nr:undecaprenyl-diphosphate phosphatase [Paludibacteraceae bacterium]